LLLKGNNINLTKFVKEVVLVTIVCREVKFSGVEAIIFDKDGTLQDSHQFLRELGQKRARLIDAKIPGVGEPMLMSFGINNDNLDHTGLMAVGSRKENLIAAAAYIAETGRSWFESLEIARNGFDEADRHFDRSEASPIFPGTVEFIKNLAPSGLKLGILSADTTAGVKEFVRIHGLKDYIQLAMGVDGTVNKPDPALFLLACERLGVKPEQTLMVGDSQGDMDMARNAGAKGCIGISWYSRGATYLKSDIIINQLEQIKIFC